MSLMHEALSRLEGEQPSHGPVGVPPSRRGGRNRLALVGGALAVLLAAAGVILVLQHTSNPPSQTADTQPIPASTATMVDTAESEVSLASLPQNPPRESRSRDIHFALLPLPSEATPPKSDLHTAPLSAELVSRPEVRPELSSQEEVTTPAQAHLVQAAVLADTPAEARERPSPQTVAQTSPTKTQTEARSADAARAPVSSSQASRDKQDEAKHRAANRANVNQLYLGFMNASSAGDHDTAADYVEQLRALLPRNGMLMLRIDAWHGMNTGDYPQAVSLYREILAREPQDIDSLMNKVSALIAMQREDTAIKVLSDARVRHPGSPRITSALQALGVSVR